MRWSRAQRANSACGPGHEGPGGLLLVVGLGLTAASPVVALRWSIANEVAWSEAERRYAVKTMDTNRSGT
jgi:hypothetical protein